MEERAQDRKGFPIREGARVYVEARVASLSSEPVSGFGGIVTSTYLTEKHGWVVEIREFDSWAKRDVKAEHVRVQAGGGTEKQKLDQEVYERVARRRKK